MVGLYASSNPWRSLSDHEDRFEKQRHGETRYKSKALTAAVPEPASAALIGVGVLAGTVRRRP